MPSAGKGAGRYPLLREDIFMNVMQFSTNPRSKKG
jgi:beta-galactosidase beta subunit